MPTLRAPTCLALALALLLPACAASPPPVEPAPPPPAPRLVTPLAAAPVDPCSALEKPLRTLRTLAAMVALGRSMPVWPLRPELFLAELEADRARARSAAAGDAELVKLAADTGKRLATLAAGMRALAAAGSEAAAEAARTSLLEEMERGELLVSVGDQRCARGESVAGHLPSSAVARVVRSGFDGFKKCYEAARNPSLRGTVRVHFVVARDGSVSEAADADRGALDPLAWAPPAAPRCAPPP